MQRLDHIIEQLWQPAIRSDALRIVADPVPDPDWVAVETYWAIPGITNLQMLLPKTDSRRVTAGAATHYRGLRTPVKNALRAVGGVGARIGLPLSRHTVAVRVHRDRRAATTELPTSMLSAALGRALYASIGVRTGDNRKATLALWTTEGAPAGYAKIGWNDVTDAYVATEARFLKEFGGVPGPMRAPALLAELDYHGHPVAVTEPLPLDVRGGHSPGIAAPTFEEIYSLTPIHRRTTPTSTAHLNALAQRLRQLARNPICAHIVETGLPLFEWLRRVHHLVPVTQRWHGDLTPWNCARDSSGQLWAWDWENCEEDAVAGLDPLHWAYSLARMRTRSISDVHLIDCLRSAGGYLTAAGLRRDLWPVLAAVYALVVVERACSLAAAHQSWATVWIPEDVLVNLVAEASNLSADVPN